VSGASGVSGYEIWRGCPKIGLMNSTTQSAPTAPSHLASRTGKIGRLPRAVRQQLNERLADGESAQVLVAWLNDCEEVRERLAQYYDGRPITEQNLSDWKQGGFQDWLRHQDARAVARDFLDRAEELREEVGDSTTLADQATEVVALALLQLFETALKAESGPEQRKAVLEIARELSRLRRGDHQRQRVQLMEERWDAEIAAATEAWEEEKKKKLRWVQAKLRMSGENLREEYLVGMANRTLSPAKKAGLEKLFEEDAAEEARLRELGQAEEAAR